MKSIKVLLAAALIVTSFASCTSTEEIAYISDAPRDTVVALHSQFSSGIQANDLLSIYVESSTPESTIQFNQETNKIAVTQGTVLNQNASQAPGYLVNDEGDIIFPVLGKIHVVGMTHNELALHLQNELINKGHITDPTVTVKLMNFKVSILGDVGKPGVLVANGERLTIFEALAMAGDLTIYGQRHNVTIIREENGNRVIGNIDLTSKEILNSPYYYLHQNDVVYVEPNMKKKRSADRDMTAFTYISSVTSIISTLGMIFYYTVISRSYLNR